MAEAERLAALRLLAAFFAWRERAVFDRARDRKLGRRARCLRALINVPFG